MDKSFNLSSFDGDLIKNNDTRTLPSADNRTSPITTTAAANTSNSSEHQNDHYTNHVETLAIACVAAVIICTTVCGNILVVVAVVTERRLRKVGNSFIVSLAVSDLLVGIVVTPFSIVHEVMGQWELGHVLCDIWICLDVTCCTASIMNLCIISFDRYNAITQPLQYACKRTPQRACVMILGAWMYSVIIALPPLLGWRETSLRDAKTCLISQDKGYTIFSTVGAFYLPLIVMFYLYGWVFRATLKRKREWVPGPGSSQVSVRMNKVRIDEASVLYNGETGDKNTTDLNTSKNGRKPKNIRVNTVNPYIGYRLMQNGDANRKSSCESLTTYVVSPRINSCLLQVEPPTQARTSIGGISVTCDGSTTYDFSGRNSAYSDSELAENKLTSKRLSIQREMRSLDIRNSVDKPERNESSANNALRTFRTAAIAINFAQSLPKKRNDILASLRTFFRRRTVDFETDDGASVSNDSNPEQEASNLKRKVRKLIRPRKKQISVTQEKRAAKTLGIIMGCFVVCWLPFFVLAVLLPFCPSCNVHPAITSFFTWLGYCNSALNPIIYTFFNQDFRRAFKKILCLRGNAFYKAICGVCSRKSCSYPV